MSCTLPPPAHDHAAPFGPRMSFSHAQDALNAHLAQAAVLRISLPTAWRCCSHAGDPDRPGRHHRLAARRQSIPAIKTYGLGIFLSAVPTWDPVKDQYGGLVPMIYGTLVTSIIALLIAVPVSFGIALFLTEMSPAWLKRPAGHGYRAAGRRAFHRLRHVGPVGVRPCPATYVQPPLQSALGNVPCMLGPCCFGCRRWASASCRPASSWPS